MDIYKANIQSDGSIYKLRLGIVVRGDILNTDLIGYNWPPTASMKILKDFLSDSVKHRSIVHQLDFIGNCLQAKVKNRVFVKLDSWYTDYFTEYSSYLGKDLRLMKSMYRMTNYGKLFAYEGIDLLINEAGFKQSQFQMNIYCKYAPYGTNISVLSDVDYCVYWYTSEVIGKWFVETIGKRLNVNLLIFAHFFISIRI